tara:strand:- start:219 stop:515 length:297 start_codon:yes stop_codon:yes gene_type:complete
MALASGVHRLRQDEWTTEYHVGHSDYPEVIGTRFTHVYSVPWASDLEALSISEGNAMPDRPASGDGSGATIDEVLHGVKDSTGREELTIVGFEALGRA